MPEEGDMDNPVESSSSGSKLKIWVQEMRAPFLTASVVPVILGTAIAWAVFGMFDWFYFVLTLTAGICVHLGTNIANDYFDHRSGNDEVNVEYVRPFTGGSRMIQRGLLTPREVISGSLFFFAISIAIGLYLAWKVGIIILIIGMVGVFSGFFYTSPPINLVSRGIGELFVGLNFGILMTLGAFYVQTATLTWEPILAAVPVALQIAAVLYINQFQDYRADRAVGKNHLVVRLGRKTAVNGYIALVFFTYASILVFIIFDLVSFYTLLVLLSLPLPILAIFFVKRYYSTRFELAPANALTVTSHVVIGILLILGYVFEEAGEGALLFLVPTIIIFALIILLIFRANWNLERQKKATVPRKSAG